MKARYSIWIGVIWLVVVAILTIVLITPRAHAATELPYDEDISVAYNGTYAVQVTDNAWTVYNHSTGQIIYQGNDLAHSLFCSVSLPHCNSYAFDPRVKYDWAHGRWIITAAIYNYNGLWMAASTGSNPLGAWYTYEIPTGGWDQPAPALTRNYMTVVEDGCCNGGGQSNTFRVNLVQAERGYLSWFYTVNGASNISTYYHPVSEQGPTLPNDDMQYTVRATALNGHPGLSIGEYNDSTNAFTADWKDVYPTATGSPLPTTYDAPGAYRGLHTWPITLETGVMASWNGQSLIFAGYPTKNGSKYTVSLFAVPAQTSTGSAHIANFTPAGEVMAVTMHPCASTGKVAVGAIETSSSIYPRLVEYSWNLASNTVSGPTVVASGNTTPVGYDATRWMEFNDGSDCVNGQADIEGQVADGNFHDTVDTFSNPYASALGFVTP